MTVSFSSVCPSSSSSVEYVSLGPDILGKGVPGMKRSQVVHLPRDRRNVNEGREGLSGFYCHGVP